MNRSIYDPWYKTTLPHPGLSSNLKLRVPHDVFSTQRIDEGTLLLLDNLPNFEPGSVLDMGCGYGALGLPIAAKFSDARVELVDRDLLAVKWSAQNALENQLNNVRAYGSLGYRDLQSSAGFDWILCNVPARIGSAFIQDLLESGRRRLSPTGEIRVVVINDLVPLLLELRANQNLPLVEVARGPRHSVFALPATNPAELHESPDLYLRDQIDLAGLLLERPFDFGGDDPKRIALGLPTLIDSLPRQFEDRLFCFRSGYGQIPLICRSRWPKAKVVAHERDLLGSTFIARNAHKLGFAGAPLEIRESASFPESLAPEERFELIVGELSPSAGEKVAEFELRTIAKLLTRGGQTLVLCLEKIEKEWIKPISIRAKMAIHPLIRRDGYVVLSMRGH